MGVPVPTLCIAFRMRPPLKTELHRATCGTDLQDTLPQDAASMAQNRFSTTSSLSHEPIGMVMTQCHSLDLMKSTKASLYGLSDLEIFC